MLLGLTPFLVSAAEISNVFTVITILVCLVGMVVFIMRLQSGDLMSSLSVKYVQHQPRDLRFNKVRIPYSISVAAGDEQAINGITLCLRCDVACLVTAYWGVRVADLQKALSSNRWPYSHFDLDGVCHYEQQSTVFSSDNSGANCHLNLQMPGDKILHLGKSPRSLYPLVTVTSGRIIEGSDFIAMISVFHIKDEECEIPTCVIGQFLIDSSMRILNLQKLYTNGDVKYPYNEKCGICNESEKSIEIEEPNLCTICQLNNISTALLPCRHVLCQDCYSKIDRCPMCRSAIAAYFTLNAHRT